MIKEYLKNTLLTRIGPLLVTKKDRPLPEEIFEINEDPVKISYCTTCMGRTEHLRRTYIKNIVENIRYPKIEFVLINYNSNDHMDDWVRKNLVKYIDMGALNYYHTRDPDTWHMSRAKNLAHRLASGDILVNLDADNFLGKDNAFYINYMASKYQNNSYAFLFSKPDFRFYDTFGRIAVRKEHFETIGGYREDLEGFSMEDIDLLKRLELIDVKIKRIEIVNFLRTIKHDNAMRLQNLSIDRDMNELRQLNSKKIDASYEKNIYKVNPSGYTSFKVYENFSDEYSIV